MPTTRRLAESVRAFSALAALLCADMSIAAPVADSASTQLASLLAHARIGVPVQCADPPDVLVRVLCSGELRVGTRGDYPPFGEATPDGPHGFEPALARQLAANLGVHARFVEVGAADRMVALGERHVDVLIATTGHTVERDEQALFVLPHYYQSRTVLVGRRQLALPRGPGLPPLAGRTVCVVVGNATNAELAVHGARLLLYGSARRLVEQIRSGACSLAAHDDTLLLPVLPADYDVKASFAPLPWGIVANRDGGATLARALGLALRTLHADGGLRRIARQQGVDTPWLQAQQARWASAPCDATSTDDDPRCIDPPHDSRLEPTPIAPVVEALERELREQGGVSVTLAMLKTRIALRLFIEGVGYSVALAVGAVLVTILFSLGLGAGRSAPQRWIRWPLQGLLLATQSMPMVMLMSGAGVLLGSTDQATPATAWLTAVTVLGLFNGSHASQAVAEARASLVAQGLPAGPVRAALRAHAQIAAFAVNATRGSPLASLIGVPELLAAQTDIASFSIESTTTFALLLAFYMALVTLVVAALERVQRRLQAIEVRT